MVSLHLINPKIEFAPEIVPLKPSTPPLEPSRVNKYFSSGFTQAEHLDLSDDSSLDSPKNNFEPKLK